MGLKARVTDRWRQVKRFDLYGWILNNLIVFLLIVTGVPFVAWVFRGWNLVPVVQLVLIAIAAVPPIAKWWRESVERLIENKPVVLSERCDNGTYEMRNVGGGTAVNVWYFASPGDVGTPLGSLQAGEARPLRIADPSVRHLLIAEARPGPRKWTFVMNVLEGSEVCHGFDPGRRYIDHTGSLKRVLADEQPALSHMWQWLPRN